MSNIHKQLDIFFRFGLINTSMIDFLVHIVKAFNFYHSYQSINKHTKEASVSEKTKTNGVKILSFIIDNQTESNCLSTIEKKICISEMLR